MGIEFHPASQGQPLKGRLPLNKAPSGCSGEETGGQEVRQEAAAMVQVWDNRDAEQREEDLKNVHG